MNQPAPRFIAPTVVALAVLAVALAGLGGMVVGDRIYPLFGAGVLVCQGMLLVFEIILSGLVSRRAMFGLAAGHGGLMAACASLFFLPGSGLPTLLGSTAGGAVLGAVCFWWYEVRHSILFDR